MLRLRDTTVGTTGMAVAVGSAMQIVDQVYANVAFSGETAHDRAWVRVASFDYRVGSYNYPSGGPYSLQPVINAIATGADYEIHDKLSPVEKDQCIDQTIARIRVRQEVVIPTVDGLLEYTIDAAASPNTIAGDPLGFWYYANPDFSLDRDQRFFNELPQIATTASGTRVLRIPAALTWSQQIVMDCLLQVTLGASDDATVSIPQVPDDGIVLDGAAARAYDLLVQRAPSQEAGLYLQRRREMAMAFMGAAAKLQPSQDTALGFAAPF